MGKNFTKEKINLEKIEYLEAQLRAGQMQSVKAFLEKIRKQKIERNLIVKVAGLARRVGYHRYALRLLTPLIRPKAPIAKSATDDEKVEYAVSLVRISLVKEAYDILSEVDIRNNPDALMFQAFCLFVSWDYAKAIPFLKKYVEMNNVSKYQKLVARTNMVAGYINEIDFTSAELELKNIFSEADNESNQLLVGYAHQLYAELWVNRGNAEKAQEHINSSKEFLQGTHFRYELYNLQWSAIIKLFTQKTFKKGQDELNQVRQNAIKKKVWEVLRDCDLYEALLSDNIDILTKLYFGTPHRKYRERILKLYRRPLAFSETYTWYPNGKSKNQNFILDVSEAYDSRSGARLKAGQLLHKLLQIIASDFYRPFKSQALFGILFPNEFYNVNTSLHKVYDLIGRLRSWFNSNEIPIDIVSTGRGEFQLKVLKPYGVKVKVFSNQLEPMDHLLNKLKNQFPNEYFSISDVMKVTGYSRTQTKLVIKNALNANIIAIEGSGRSTRYYLK